MDKVRHIKISSITLIAIWIAQSITNGENGATRHGVGRAVGSVLAAIHDGLKILVFFSRSAFSVSAYQTHGGSWFCVEIHALTKAFSSFAPFFFFFTTVDQP